MILLIVFVGGFCVAATPVVSAASDSMRWGIVPKNSSRSRPEATAPNDKTTDPSKPETGPPGNSSQPEPSKRKAPEDTDSIPAARDEGSKSAVPDSTRPPVDLSQTPSSARKSAPAVKTTPVSKKKQDKSKSTSGKINWANDRQQKACEAYLTQLQGLFLKTRHYSIQGASCDTAENATAFLQTWKKCSRECPKAFLDQSGYNARIIRNITYLEKLGKDRCDEAPGPVAPPLTTQKNHETGSRK